MAAPDVFNLPMNTLPGVGVKTAHNFAKLNIYSVWDLLRHLPVRYEDRTRIQAISGLIPGTSALILGEIDFADILPRGRRSLICRIQDGTGFLDLRFSIFLARQYEVLKPGTKLSCFGEIRYGYNGLEMVHPDYSVG